MKIVFILNSITITRCQKRVEEFIDNGYEVDVYGFARSNQIYSTPKRYKIEQIGFHSISMNYFQRLIIIAKSLKSIHKKYKHQKNVIFYYFFFDIAFAASLISNRTYIYEESDIPYANIKPLLLRKFLKWKDRKIIQKSLITTMTSEGFIKYHNLEKSSSNIILIPNRVNSKLLQLPYRHKILDINNISIGFVGGFRYQSIYNFANVIAHEFSNISFHFFGNFQEYENELRRLSSKYQNIIIHGLFKNPDDLPSIYEQIDLVLATYDVTSINAQYAEPNKMYESIFFRVPIIVSKSTFVSEKIESLGIGYSVNGLDTSEIKSFLSKLNKGDIEAKIQKMKIISQKDVINNNPNLFKYLKNILK